MRRLALFFVVLAIVAGAFGIGRLVDAPSMADGLLVYLLLGAAVVIYIADMVRGR